MTALVSPVQRQEPTKEPSLDVPPLQDGDRLTRAEFERRYEAMPELKKAELIEGVVHMGSPVSANGHAEPHFDLITLLGLYRLHTPGVVGGDNATLRLDLDNEPQPDAYLRILPEFGGQAILDAKGYVVGAPELVAEVAVSSVSYDLHDKLNAYRRNQVREYLVWRVRDREVDWFVLREGQFEKLPLGEDGLLRSETLPGLWLDPRAVVSREAARMFEVAMQGVASPEHPTFLAQVKTVQQVVRPTA
jgi:putative restriction endonuclease